MRFFSCSLCKEKDARIADLKDQIRRERELNAPNNSTSHETVIEADAVISGTQHIIEIDEPAADSAELEKRERDQLLAGTY